MLIIIRHMHAECHRIFVEENDSICQVLHAFCDKLNNQSGHQPALLPSQVRLILRGREIHSCGPKCDPPNPPCAGPQSLSDYGIHNECELLSLLRSLPLSRVFVKDLHGWTTSIDVTPYSTVCQVMAKVFDVKGIPHYNYWQQRLICSGDKLLGCNFAPPCHGQCRTLGDYRIRHDATVHLVSRPYLFEFMVANISIAAKHQQCLRTHLVLKLNEAFYDALEVSAVSFQSHDSSLVEMEGSTLIAKVPGTTTITATCQKARKDIPDDSTYMTCSIEVTVTRIPVTLTVDSTQAALVVPLCSFLPFSSLPCPIVEPDVLGTWKFSKKSSKNIAIKDDFGVFGLKFTDSDEISAVFTPVEADLYECARASIPVCVNRRGLSVSDDDISTFFCHMGTAEAVIERRILSTIFACWKEYTFSVSADPFFRKAALDVEAGAVDTCRFSRARKPILIIELTDAGNVAEYRETTSLPFRLNSKCFSPCGRSVAIERFPGVLSIYNLANGREIFRSFRHFCPDDMRISFVFSPDGNSIATRDYCCARIFDVATGRELLKIKSDHRHADLFDGWYVYFELTHDSVCFSPDGNTVAIAHLDVKSGAFGIFCVANGRQILTVTPTLVAKYHRSDGTGCRSLSFSPDGTTIALGCDDGYVRFYDTVTGRESLSKIKLKLRREDRCLINLSVDFSPDGQKVVIMRYNGVSIADTGDRARALECSVYDIATRRKILDADKGGFCFSPDGKRIALHLQHFSGPTAIGIFDAATGSEMARTINHKSLSICFSSDSKRIVSISGEFDLRMFDVSSGREVLTLYPTPFQKHSDFAHFLPDGKLLVCDAHCGLDTRYPIHIFDATPQNMEGDYDVELEHKEEMRAEWKRAESSVCIDQPEREHVSNEQDTSARAVERDSHEKMPWMLKKMLKIVFPTQRKGDYYSLSGYKMRVECVCFSLDGKFIFSGESSEARWATTEYEDSAYPGILRKFDVSTGKEVSKIVIAKALGVLCMSLSPDCRCFALGCGDGIARIYDANERLVWYSKKHDDAITCCCFSSNGQMLVTADCNILSVSEENCLTRVAVYCQRGPNKYTCVFGNGMDHQMFDGCVTSVTFSPDGNLIAMGGYGGDMNDGFISIIDVQNLLTRGDDRGVQFGQASLMLHVSTHRHRVAVSFSADGQSIIATGLGVISLVGPLYGLQTLNNESLRLKYCNGSPSHCDRLPRCIGPQITAKLRANGITRLRQLMRHALAKPDFIEEFGGEDGAPCRAARVFDFLHDVQAGEEYFNSATFSPDSKSIAISSCGALRIIDVATGSSTFDDWNGTHFMPDDVHSLYSGIFFYACACFSPDGLTVAHVASNPARIRLFVNVQHIHVCALFARLFSQSWRSLPGRRSFSVPPALRAGGSLEVIPSHARYLHMLLISGFCGRLIQALVLPGMWWWAQALVSRVANVAVWRTLGLDHQFDDDDGDATDDDDDDDDGC